MRMSKKSKRTIIGLVGFCMAAVIFGAEVMTNVTDVQAETKVFDKIKDTYQTENATTFTILEIEPTAETYKVDKDQNADDYKSTKAELGYLFSDTRYSDEMRGFGKTSQGRALGDPNYNLDNNRNEYAKILLKMRNFGMIKPDGIDAQRDAQSVGEYLFYAPGNAIFSTFKTGDYEEFTEKTFVKGIYSMKEGGEYQLTDGYEIDKNGRICLVKQESVSENDLTEEDRANIIGPDESVSSNSIVKRLEPVTIDTTKMGLPVAADGTKLVTHVGQGGNLTFTRSLNTSLTHTEYWGYVSDDESGQISLYYATSLKGSQKHYNSNWFQEYVFGNYVDYKNKMTIKYITKAANEVTAKDIETANLIYINGTNTEFINAKQDISDDVLLTLFNKVAVDHKALIMDYLNYSPESAESQNISKLALLLWQTDYSNVVTRAQEKGLYNSTTEKIESPKDSETNKPTKTSAEIIKELFEDKEFVSGLKTTIMYGGNGNFVTGNTYVYNHHIADFDSPRAMVDALDFIGNGDFTSYYTSAVASSGFSEVLSYINTTNKNSLEGTMPTRVSPAVAVQYILVSDGRGLAVVKNSLNILEIQPTTAFLYNEKRESEEYADLASNSKTKKNRDAFIAKYLSAYYNQDTMKKFITFESMSIDEFNGRNEDLVETYDIVYIGGEIGNYYYTTVNSGTSSSGSNVNTYTAVDGIYNPISSVTGDNQQTTAGTSNAVKKDLPVYTDKAMTGMIYYNIGDLVTANNWLLGYLDTDPSTEISAADLADKESNRDANITRLNGKTSTTRYPGRDITKTKLAKLEEYVKANCLVVVDGSLMGAVGTKDNIKINPTAVNSDVNDNKNDHGRVDNASNLYEFLQYTLGYIYNKETGEYENKVTDSVTQTSDASTDTNAAENAGGYKRYVGSNVVTTSQFEAGTVTKDTVSKYVATEKLTLTLNKKPTEYSYLTKQGTQIIDSDTVQYLEQDSDGSRTLTYQFVIGADATDGNIVTTYKPHLYIDINNDGKYSARTEEIADITVEVTGSGAEAEKNANGEYVLYKDIEYTMKRAIAKDYCGLLKWKLDVEAYQYANSHASEEGYTLAKNITGNEKICSILQITNYPTKRHYTKDGKTPGSTLNLEEAIKDQNGTYGKYLNNIPGYKVVVSTLDVSQFEDDFDTKWTEESQKPAHKSLEDFALEYFASYMVGEEKDTAGNVTKEGVKGANMLVLGFGDDYANFTKMSAMKAVEAFMESGKPTLLAHDFIGFNSGFQQVTELRNLVGMDRYGNTQNILSDDSKTVFMGLANKSDAAKGLNYLHSGSSYTRTAANAAEVNLIESTGKTVAYQPGMARKTILPYTQGFSNTLICWKRNGQSKNWLNSNLVYLNGNGEANYTVNKMNDGQITTYPYILPDSFRVSQTHSQYFQLDLDADDDNDKESDVVVWYTMGDSNLDSGKFNPYADTVGGPMATDGYYIYNKGNITYAGAGHGQMNGDSLDSEAQLFVNTLMASFTAKYTAPDIGFFETSDLNATAISSLAIPYDKNVTKPVDPDHPKAENTAVDSSILTNTDGTRKYQFVDPNTDTTIDEKSARTIGTPMYFRLNDTNFVRGNKYLTIKYYLKAEGKESGDEYKLKVGNSEVKARVETVNKTSAVDISQYINTYTVANGSFGAVIAKDTLDGNKVKNLSSMATYGFYLPLSYLNDTGAFTIIMEAQTTVKTVSSTTGQEDEEKEIEQKAYQELTVTKTDLLDLD